MDQLQKVINIYKENISKTDLEKKDLKSLGKIIKNNSNMHLIPIVSNSDFQSLLVSKKTRYNFQNINLKQNENFHVLEKVINAFCNPDVISIITNKILEED